MIVPIDRDAFGAELREYQRSGASIEVIERDDGYISASQICPYYFSDYDEWTEHERNVISEARGSVLDIGCGAGRVSLYLQRSGHRVIALDNSPGAIEICAQRGVRKALLASITRIPADIRDIDTIIMFGNNLGLFGTQRRARWLLRQFKNRTTDGARIIATTSDPHRTSNPAHLAYHRGNIERGNLAGEMRIRVRHQRCIGPWMEYLLVSQSELANIVSGTGWIVASIVDGEAFSYGVVLEKERS